MRHDETPWRVTEQRSTGPTLEWESLPVLGEADHRDFRARVWRWTGLALTLFWVGVVWSIWG